MTFSITSCFPRDLIQNFSYIFLAKSLMGSITVWGISRMFTHAHPLLCRGFRCEFQGFEGSPFMAPVAERLRF